MKKHILIAALSLSICLLGGTTALAINPQSTPSQNPAEVDQQTENKLNQAPNAYQTPRYIHEIKNEFIDIQNDWSREEVLAAYAKGLVTGYEDFTFRPNAAVSNLETLVLIINAMGLREKAQNYDLSDEQAALLAGIPDWGKNYMALALDQELLTGKELPNFNAQQAPKRYEVCMYMNRVLANDDTIEITADMIFSDENQIPSANLKDVFQMWTNGIVSGYPDGKFQPMQAVKRNELITMLNKLDDNCLQTFAASTVQGTVYAVIEIDGGYTISIENAPGDMVDVNTNAQTKLFYKGQEITTIDIESTLKAKILLNQNGEAVLVRFADDEEATLNEIEELDDADEIDILDEDNDANELNKLDKTNKYDNNNKSYALDQIDILS